jgi:sulfite oxidase
VAGAVAIMMFTATTYADDNKSNQLNAAVVSSQAKDSEEEEEEEEEDTEYVVRDWSHLPYFELDDVAKHKTLETGVWVFFEDGVYDITEFIELHPGGKKILEAAGSSIAPFWLQYRQHDHPTVREVLAELRIGNLKNPPPEAYIQTVAANAQSGAQSDDPYANEPMRTADFIISMLKPFNAEPKLDELTKCFLTPNSHFFVRNHLPVPRVNPETYRLKVGGEGRPTVEFTLEDLKTKFPPRTIVNTIQCAGNRRSEINAVAKVQGLDWQGGAISTAVFTGARLRDVLASVGLTDEEIEKEEYKHVQFEGYDKDATGSHYGASILIDKIESKKSDVLLAYEMNGEPIPLDHGFPVRAVVPGVVGARNVKWLRSVLLSHNESQSHWQQNDYKGFGPNITFKDADYKSGYSIQELPVTSVICEPPNNAKVKPGQEITLKGYAWSGKNQK